MYPDNVTQVHTITDNLEEAASEWLVPVHVEDAMELIDLDTFRPASQEHFRDPVAACCAETRIYALKRTTTSDRVYPRLPSTRQSSRGQD